MNQHTALFGGTTIPSHVEIEIVHDLSTLVSRIGDISMGGIAGTVLFGSAFKQGLRMQFTSAVPIETLRALAEVDRSAKRDDVMSVKEKSNRPEETAQARAIKTYLLETACVREKFVLPSFTLNFGVGLYPDSAKVKLIVFASSMSKDNTTFPAIVVIPRGTRLYVTDGGHRTTQIDDLLSDQKIDLEMRDALRENAVGITLIFESSRVDSHQDFADCGKAKAISKSLLSVFDQRDEKNRASIDLIANSPFLKHYVDATASVVNLSGNSKKAWSAAGWRNFVNHVADAATWGGDAPLPRKMRRAPDFIRALVEHLDTFMTLEAARTARNATQYQAPKDFRNARGGNILMRSVGISILANAYVWAVEERLSFVEVAKALNLIDWNLLKVQRSELPTGEAEEYRAAVLSNATPMWSGLLVVGDLKYRIAASKEHAERAFAHVKAAILAHWAEAGLDPTDPDADAEEQIRAKRIEIAVGITSATMQ